MEIRPSSLRADGAGGDIGAGATAGFLNQPDAGDFHRFVGGFEHVIERQAGDRGARQRFHLDAGLSVDADFGDDAQACIFRQRFKFDRRPW